MLLFSSDTFTIDGITVFPDHADHNQFWYLPGPVGLAPAQGTAEPQFLLMMYAPGVVTAGGTGVGFLDVTLALRLQDGVAEDMIGQIHTHFPDADNPRLTPVAFDEGSVQIVALDLQGSGGTSAVPQRDGTFEAVERILGATSPELFGDNNALFALSLTEAGATILKAAFQDGMTPVGGIYTLKFTGARPALDVRVTADLKRCYDSFSIGLSAQAYWVSAGIDATFEKLRQDGSIKVEIINLTTDAVNADKENWALNLFKEQLLSDWFKPSLSPLTAQAADAASVGTGAAAAASLQGQAASTNQTHAASSASPTLAAPSQGSATQGSLAQGSLAAPSLLATGVHAPAAPLAGGPVAPAQAGSLAQPARPQTPAGQASPPPAQSPPPVSNSGSQAVSPVNALAGAASQISKDVAGSHFGVSLKLKFVKQEELKTVTVEYNRMDAIQRTYAPQGLFGLLVDKLDQSKHFLEIEGSDPFFNTLSVTVTPPRDFAGIGLLSAQVSLKFGDPDDPAGERRGDLLFDAAHTAPQSWEVTQGQVHDTHFRVATEYQFDPESGWQAEQNSYILPETSTESRSLTLDPYDTLGFLNVAVTPGRIDAAVVDRVELTLSYLAPSGWSAASMLVVRPDSPAQSWKLRLADKTQRSYSTVATCFLKDGTTFKSAAVTSAASAVVVNDAFAGALELTIQPAFDPAHTRLAIVELAYRDDAHGYTYQTTLQFAGNAAATRVRIPVVDRSLAEYSTRFTFVETNGTHSQWPTVMASDPLVLVVEPASGG